MKKYKFNKEWLNKLLEVKDNDYVWLSLSDNDTRILLTYIEVLQSKIDKAIEYIEKEYDENIVICDQYDMPITPQDLYNDLINILKREDK